MCINFPETGVAEKILLFLVVNNSINHGCNIKSNMKAVIYLKMAVVYHQKASEQSGRLYLLVECYCTGVILGRK